MSKKLDLSKTQFLFEDEETGKATMYAFRRRSRTVILDRRTNTPVALWDGTFQDWLKEKENHPAHHDLTSVWTLVPVAVDAE